MKSFGVRVGLALMTFTGTAIGVLPIWTSILALGATTLFLAKEFSGALNPFESQPAIEPIIRTWTKILYEQKTTPIRQNWNCKNCGGPNINQVKCEYCGMVKE